MVISYLPLVMASPWLSCANRAECWAAVSFASELLSMNTGGGPGGGGGGGQGPSEEALNSEVGAMGPWAKHIDGGKISIQKYPHSVIVTLQNYWHMTLTICIWPMLIAAPMQLILMYFSV